MQEQLRKDQEYALATLNSAAEEILASTTNQAVTVMWLSKDDILKNVKMDFWSSVKRPIFRQMLHHAWMRVCKDEAHAVVAMRDALQRAVDLYGKPGGPWNVPGDPGGWLSQAREALEKAPAIHPSDYEPND